ncbi:hypothetical protein Pint_04504 [Pistacia integerrima]|uniref:Uncharacterized protein n=1 Tax=Pistacia integerrima TaxID=434235 RepID=A0ACC0Z2S5_9ROSI|nr:hypothetical protein Pint_04504 [Pistacia integerrima]
MDRARHCGRSSHCCSQQSTRLSGSIHEVAKSGRGHHSHPFCFVTAAPDAGFSTAVTSLKPEGQGRLIHSFHVCFILEFSVLLLGQSYDSMFLKIYPWLQPTPLQLGKDLEQLKVIENGYKMKVIKVDHEAHGVDTPEDVEKIESFMRERNLS